MGQIQSLGGFAQVGEGASVGAYSHWPLETHAKTTNYKGDYMHKTVLQYVWCSGKVAWQ